MKLLAILATVLAISISPAVFASGKPAPKVDCTQKKNVKKIECKKAPTSDVKAVVKKPAKVDRKAPKSVQQKAEQAKK
jgi:hypothetical protein